MHSALVGVQSYAFSTRSLSWVSCIMSESGSGPVNWAAFGARGEARREETMERDAVQKRGTVMSQRGRWNGNIRGRKSQTCFSFFSLFFFSPCCLLIDVRSYWFKAFMEWIFKGEIKSPGWRGRKNEEWGGVCSLKSDHKTRAGPCVHFMINDLI